MVNSFFLIGIIILPLVFIYLIFDNRLVVTIVKMGTTFILSLIACKNEYIFVFNYSGDQIIVYNYLLYFK